MNKCNLKKKLNAGFTLMELVIVMAITAIVLTLFFPLMTSVSDFFTSVNEENSSLAQWQLLEENLDNWYGDLSPVSTVINNEEEQNSITLTLEDGSMHTVQFENGVVSCFMYTANYGEYALLWQSNMSYYSTVVFSVLNNADGGNQAIKVVATEESSNQVKNILLAKR